MSKCGQWIPGVPESVSGIYKGKITFIEIVRHDLPFPCVVCAMIMQKQWRVKLPAPEHKSRPGTTVLGVTVFFTVTYLQETKSQFYLGISSNSLINTQLLNTHLFNILYEQIRSKHKARALHTEVWWLSQAKHFMLVWELN